MLGNRYLHLEIIKEFPSFFSLDFAPIIVLSQLLKKNKEVLSDFSLFPVLV